VYRAGAMVAIACKVDTVARDVSPIYTVCDCDTKKIEQIYVYKLLHMGCVFAFTRGIFALAVLTSASNTSSTGK
jgi:hypothetical protein